MISWMPQSVFSLLKFAERVFAYAQGKGYGSTSIGQEVAMVHALLGRAPRLAVDIGGNKGDYTAELRYRNPDLEIHIFEPSATNLEKLNARFASDPKVTVVPYAASSQPGEATLHADVPGSGGGSLTRRRLDHFGVSFDFNETIKTMRFGDYWMQCLNRAPIDILKMDIEGHEFNALQGFGDAIRATKVIQFEFGGCNIDTHTYFQDFWYFFKSHGFEMYWVSPFGLAKIPGYTEADEFFSTTNFIVVNTRQS